MDRRKVKRPQDALLAHLPPSLVHHFRAACERAMRVRSFPVRRKRGKGNFRGFCIFALTSITFSNVSRHRVKKCAGGEATSRYAVSDQSIEAGTIGGITRQLPRRSCGSIDTRTEMFRVAYLSPSLARACLSVNARLTSRAALVGPVHLS